MSSVTRVASPAEGLTCFVCDGTVVGRYYTLASCKTQVTKQKLVEKLGQLVGEQYMVVISEDDIICRSCTTMLNNLDRLEKEMSSARAVILRFLEKKYELEEGELLNSQVVLPPPPTIPDSVTAFKKPESSVPTFHERKKQSAAAEVEGKANVWMQCDRCKYTTPYSSFMINHIHKHGEDKKLEQPEDNDTPQEAAENSHELEVEVPPLEAEVGEAEEEEEGDVMVNGDGGGEEIGVDGGGGGGEESGEPAIVEMDMAEENICMVDENGILQKVQQSEDGQFYVVEGDIDGAKQMLSVAEDGSVQMVQVMWDDIVAAENNMQF
ncbi:uncharacterized protein LOC128996962 isoform X2 [Macrosteles quadrilineatus]|uniref:uncharacterized protein LOC128996962 isoform X2 n=1 Tax=Macrosteles quadrilineatus TaxID=74068 RepID=UPI0023E2E367|nr:uncharacterized protein LOC128996962 isoform X2 [Macrosteles quadrilineatus]